MLPSARAWRQEAEHFVAQRRYQKAIEIYTRTLVVDPAHVPALQGRTRAYRKAGMEQAAARDERTLQALLFPKQSREEFSMQDESTSWDEA